MDRLGDLKDLPVPPLDHAQAVPEIAGAAAGRQHQGHGALAPHLHQLRRMREHSCRPLSGPTRRPAEEKPAPLTGSKTSGTRTPTIRADPIAINVNCFGTQFQGEDSKSSAARGSRRARFAAMQGDRPAHPLSRRPGPPRENIPLCMFRYSPLCVLEYPGVVRLVRAERDGPSHCCLRRRRQCAVDVIRPDGTPCRRSVCAADDRRRRGSAGRRELPVTAFVQRSGEWARAREQLRSSSPERNHCGRNRGALLCAPERRGLRPEIRSLNYCCHATQAAVLTSGWTKLHARPFLPTESVASTWSTPADAPMHARILEFMKLSSQAMGPGLRRGGSVTVRARAPAWPPAPVRLGGTCRRCPASASVHRRATA